MTPQVGIAAHHGGFAPKTGLLRSLRARGCDVVDFGAHELITAHQGVEDDGMKVARLGGPVIGTGLALYLMHAFLNALFSGAPHHQRRLATLRAIEHRDP